MRISLIHGENSLAAYKKFRELVDSAKSKGFESITIDDIHKIVSQSLFEEKVVFVLENPKKVKLNDWKWLAKNAPKYNSNLLIFYEGNAPVAVTKNLPKDSKIESFSYPKIIFSFLDSFFPGNSQKSLKLLSELSKNDSIELVLHLLARHLRDLYWAKADDKSMDYPDWRVLKIIKQADKFSMEKLKKVINELARIDMEVKTSKQDLKSSLDIAIVKHLQ